MLVTIESVLAEAAMGDIRRVLEQGQFVDGKLSAGKAAAGVKNNLEGRLSPQQLEPLYRLVIGGIAQQPKFRSAALPQKVSDPIFAKYVPGMNYGPHIDDPVMGQSQRYRCDVAVTLFLNDPDNYEGGELSVQTPFGDQKVKLPAGHAVVYPASSLHQVMPVTGGERLVAVMWVQSLIRDPAKRELLFELDQARESLLDNAPEEENTKRIDRSYLNLVRMWAEL